MTLRQTGGYTTVPFNSSVTIDNVECDSDLTFTVVVTGLTSRLTYTGVNHVNLPVTFLPANITITDKEHPGASLELFYYDNHPLSVMLGSGPDGESYYILAWIYMNE